MSPTSPGHPAGVKAAAATVTPAKPRSGMRALVVEDEAALAGLLLSYFERDGFDASCTGDGLQAVQLAREIDPDVVVLDLGLPGLDGVEVCRQLRTFCDAYVIMVTARSEEVDTLIGLSVGADDYLTKPFSPRELMARVQVMLRRPRLRSHHDTTAVRLDSFGTLSIDRAGREVWLQGERVSLTRTEFELLATLSERPKIVFTRHQLIDHVWGPGWVGDEHLVDVHIGHLRRKLKDDASGSRFVRTVRGIGYRMGTGQ